MCHMCGAVQNNLDSFIENSSVGQLHINVLFTYRMNTSSLSYTTENYYICTSLATSTVCLLHTNNVVIIYRSIVEGNIINDTVV